MTLPHFLFNSINLFLTYLLSYTVGSMNFLPAYCQTPPNVAHAQLLALLNSNRAIVKDGIESGKVMIDTASAYQVLL
jgi:hypothetical protein